MQHIMHITQEQSARSMASTQRMPASASNRQQRFTSRHQSPNNSLTPLTLQAILCGFMNIYDTGRRGQSKARNTEHNTHARTTVIV